MANQDPKRRPENENNNRPKLSILWLIIAVLIAKNRHGETGKVELAWSPQYTTFSSLDYRHEED